MIFNRKKYKDLNITYLLYSALFCKIKVEIQWKMKN